jgi:hypothetical protein
MRPARDDRVTFARKEVNESETVANSSTSCSPSQPPIRQADVDAAGPLFLS